LPLSKSVEIFSALLYELANAGGVYTIIFAIVAWAAVNIPSILVPAAAAATTIF
jgi:hypothetical protein